MSQSVSHFLCVSRECARRNVKSMICDFRRKEQHKSSYSRCAFSDCELSFNSVDTSFWNLAMRSNDVDARKY
jgi:hypothetical protein